MYSFEQDHTAAARATATFDTSYQPCAAGRSLHLSAHHPGQQQQLLRTAAAGSMSMSGSGSAAAAAALQPRRGKSGKKHAASSSRRSRTTVVATDVDNFRAMVQELTGFPPAAIFRPLPRRVHAASPFVAVAAAAGQGCGGGERHGHGGSEATNSSAFAGAGNSPDDAAPAVPPVALPQQPQLFAPLGVFDGLSDLAGSPEFDSWGDLSID